MKRIIFILLLVSAIGLFWANAEAQEESDPETDDRPAVTRTAASSEADDADDTDDDTVEIEAPAPVETGPASFGIASNLWGRIVKEMKYDLPPWMSNKEFRQKNKIKIDKKLTPARVRATIRRFFLLGYVDNVVVKAEELDDQNIRIIIKIYPSYIVRDVNVIGNQALSDTEIIEDILKLEVGEDYHKENLSLYEKKLTDAYRDVGHLKADVKIYTDKTKIKQDNKVDLTIEVNEHKVYRVNKIELIGNYLPLTRNKILRIMKWKEGMEYEKVRVEKGLKRLKEWLKKKKYFEAQVSGIDLDDPDTVRIDDERRTIAFKLRVDTGPRIEMAYESGCFTCAQKKWKLKNQLDVENNRRFTRYIIEPFVQKIEEYFRLRGYLDVLVTGDFEESVDENGEPVKRLTFRMEKGKKYSIEEVDFKNNPSYTDKELSNELGKKDFFVPEDFDKSLENIISFYNRNGFIRAKILQKFVDIDEGTGEVRVQVVVSEGPRALIESVTLEGNKVFPTKRFTNLLDQADLVPGRPYNPFISADIKTRMIAKYLIKGYIKAKIKEKIDISEDGTKVNAAYVFDEGKKYYYGDIYVHGNKLTKTHVITRELFITTGEVFNYEEVFESQQQLMKLGFFNSVEISPVDPDIDEEAVDLIVTVNERNSGYIESGLGYNTYSGYQGAFELGHKNLAGHGRSLSFRTDVNFREDTFRFDQRTVTIAVGVPWFGRLPADVEMNVTESQKEMIGYTVRTLGTTVAYKVDFPRFFYRFKPTHKNETLRSLSKYWSGRLSYSYSRDFLLHIDSSVEDQQPGEVKIATLSPELTRDSRDNPFNPITGKVYYLMLEWGAPPLLSEVAYLKAIGQYSWIIPAFRWWSDKKRDKGLVLALNAKAGHAQELRATDTIPINRRFYLGGSTTIRGFGQDEISPMGEDGRTPVGGYFFAYTNAEIRTPIGDSPLGLLFFFDAGNVTNEVKTYYIDLVRPTAGMGFRYLTPVGPISADYGFKLNKQHGESMGEFYITVGNAF